MATIEQIVEKIRTAVYGSEVRSSIAEGIEKCYSDVTDGETLIDALGGPIVEKANNALEVATAANNTSANALSIAESTNTSVDYMSAQASSLGPDADPTVQVTTVNDHKHIAFGIPRGLSAVVVSQQIAYHESSNGVTPPDDDNWTANPPQSVTAGGYLWVRTTLVWNTDDEDTVFYSVTRNGTDGDGSFTVGLGPERTYSPVDGRIELPLDVVATNGSDALITSGAAYSIQESVSDVIENAESNLAIIESGETATNNILQSQYVIWNRTLYVAKTNIEVGDTLSSDNLEIVQKGGLNAVSPKVVSTMTELVDYVMDTPGVPVLMTIANGSEALTTLLPDTFSSEEDYVTECIARYYSNTVIDCYIMNINGVYMVRYNSSLGEVSQSKKYIPAGGMFLSVPYTSSWSLNKVASKTINATAFNNSTYGTMAAGVPGYTPCGITYFASGNNNVWIRTVQVINASGTAMIVVSKNGSSATDSGTASITVMYVKSDFIS